MRLGKLPFVAGLVALVGLASALVAVGPAAAAPSVTLTASAAPVLPAGAARLGAVPAGTTIHFDVALNIRDEAGLDALLQGVENRNSPYFGHFLRPGQFAQLFGPTQAQVTAVESSLRSLGLTPGTVDSDRLSIPVSGTAAAVDRAFGLSLVDYRLPGGRVAFANSAAPRIPAAVAPYIQGVLGLDTLYAVRDNAVTIPVRPAARGAGAASPAGTATPSAPATPGPKACNAAADQAVTDGAFTAGQLAAHYGIAPLYGMGDLGQGVKVAVVELEANLNSDIVSYENCYKIKTAVHYFNVDGGDPAGAGSSEAALDIENIVGLTPESVIDVYRAPNTVAELYQDVNHIVSLDKDRVISISWGLCELDETSAQLAAYQTVMKAANSQAQTVVAASGDNGSTDCYPNDTTNATKLAVESPASANYVTAVGGTSMRGGVKLVSKEVVWNGSTRSATSDRGASGGGISTLCMPLYQDYNQVNPNVPAIPGLISLLTKKSSSCVSKANDPKGYLRQVPDISADADPYTGYDFYWKGSWAYLWGGTSESTSLAAAEAALIDASPWCGAAGWQGGPVGLLPQALYGRAAQDQIIIYLSGQPLVFYDVTSGNNNFTPSGLSDGLYPASQGYDFATGLGAPLMTGAVSPATFNEGLASEMCDWAGKASLEKISTTSVVPSTGKAGKPITVTVHGTGFLTIKGVDAAEILVKGKDLGIWMATCSSRTTCKVTLPARPAGTIDVEMLVANFIPCLKCRAFVPFTYKK